jgi:23S rRNA pseudouridine2605 synthase
MNNDENKSRDTRPPSRDFKSKGDFQLKNDFKPRDDTLPPKVERIAKRLARAGISSRRDAELLIADGRVSVNGVKLASPAINVSPSDKIFVDGLLLPEIERTRLWLYHKPVGLVTTSKDPEGRPTVFSKLPKDLPRVISIGRLDINTEGLLLLTNDGGVARMLELPATGWLRRYRVRAFGKVTQEQLNTLKDGVTIEGVFYGAIDAVLEREQGSNVWINLGLREGKNREVKNVMGSLGLNVNRLIRMSFGPFQLGDLPEGAVVEVNGRTLREQLGERMIEQSGANFDAPVLNAFSNSPVRGDFVPFKDPPAHRKYGDWVGGTDNPIVKRQRKPQFDKNATAESMAPKRTTRGVNVWMGTDAKPKSAAQLDEEALAPKFERSERGKRDFTPRADKAFGDRPPRDFKPRGDNPRGDGERPNRDFKPRGDTAFGEKRDWKPRGESSNGDKPPRDFKPRGDSPRGDTPFGEKREWKPRGESSNGDKPPRDFKPRGDSPRGDKPFGERPKRDFTPRSDTRPSSGRPFAGKSSGNKKPYSGKPRPKG